MDEIERMWRLLGWQPTATDVVKGNICKYSIDTFKRIFGGWRKALEAFVVYINAMGFGQAGFDLHTNKEILTAH